MSFNEPLTLTRELTQPPPHTSTNDLQHMVILSNGDMRWRVDNKLHREGGLPAIIKADGTMEWFDKGLRHREGSYPQSIHPRGAFEYKLNDRENSTNGFPSYIDCTETKKWSKDGDLHREGDLPAYISNRGEVAWSVEGEEVRSDMTRPTRIGPSGELFWCQNGGDRGDDLPSNISHSYMSSSKNDVEHRDGGKPSTIIYKGLFQWMVDGKSHREDELPSTVDKGEGTEWSVHGVSHRFSGPAQTREGYDIYMLFGEWVTEEEHAHAVQALGGIETVMTLPYAYLEKMYKNILSEEKLEAAVESQT